MKRVALTCAFLLTLLFFGVVVTLMCIDAFHNLLLQTVLDIAALFASVAIARVILEVDEESRR